MCETTTTTIDAITYYFTNFWVGVGNEVPPLKFPPLKNMLRKICISEKFLDPKRNKQCYLLNFFPWKKRLKQTKKITLAEVVEYIKITPPEKYITKIGRK